MEITNTIKPKDRRGWRVWLEEHHHTLTEIWLLSDNRPEQSTLTYLDAVEEAICFGWIDGIQKRYSTHELAQRFTPRKQRSNWTELNLITLNCYESIALTPFNRPSYCDCAQG
jgi:uncharacterized protein YdeI (YjbR/CyaY-like superfamily)